MKGCRLETTAGMLLQKGNRSSLSEHPSELEDSLSYIARSFLKEK
ncbi:rCG28270 [Rattus norvegicus]|uniref:RCG28270 n=1 Tax=Rattus norvegicus TaxID=10116 RepID=A6IFB3_RAT|nr:rCG28270 [Rattus norvegicus]